MKHLVLASFFSALLGGMSGTGLVLWMTQPEAPPVPPVPAGVVSGQAELARRLEVVEQALAGIAPRVRVLSPELAGEPEPARTEPASLGAAHGASASPVFEAAVLDIIDRAEAERDGSGQQRDRYWANDLTMRLGLSPAQTERLLAIQTELAKALDSERRAAREVATTPDQRRATRQSIRRHADEQLRSVLAPRQQAAYDQLDGQLRLYRSKSGG